jgi:uncharacterized protein (TIGR02679 family)
MTDMADPRLDRLLGGDGLAQLRKRLRRRFEQDVPPEAFRLDGLCPPERGALASLMGQAVRQAESIRVDVAAIDAALQRAGIAESLRHALERLDGPIIHRAGERARSEALWAAIAAGARHPGLVAVLQSTGLLKRLGRQDASRAILLRDGADAVLERLPAAGLPRAQLAAEILGDAHALDAGQPVATLVLAALRQSESCVGERARDHWAQAGVLVNELARPALFLNLPTRDGVAQPGEPAYASLRLLLRAQPKWAVAGRHVHVCENPNLLAIAADQLGEHCAPLVCTDGMPAAAQRTLLTQLAAAGARLLYHGDFDWPGITIANHVIQTYGARPWRFGAVDYENVKPRHGHKLAGTPVPACWDDALMPAMQDQGWAIAEESLVASLLPDLEHLQ